MGRDIIRAMKATTIRSGLADLAIESTGSGPPVVLLHAGVADRRMWAHQLATLAGAGFAAHAYDRRGFGESLHVDEEYSHANDLLAILDHVSPRRPALLVGCSQGGRIAIDACLARPGRVGALMLVSTAVSGAPGPGPTPPAIEAWIARLDQAEAANDVDAINALEAHAWLDGPLERDGRIGGAIRELFLAMNEMALRAEQRGTELPPAAAWTRLSEIRVPTLVTWGDLDFPHVAAVGDHAARTIPQARRHVFKGAAHLPSLEQPVAFDRLLVDFCRAGAKGPADRPARP